MRWVGRVPITAKDSGGGWCPFWFEYEEMWENMSTMKSCYCEHTSRHKIAIKALLVVALALSMIIGNLSCTFSSPYTPISSELDLSFQETTVEAASEIMGVNTPFPTYLPQRLEIKEVYINCYEVDACDVIILISDEEITRELVTKTTSQGIDQYYEVKSKMRMEIKWRELIVGGLKLPGEVVTINGFQGKILEDGTLWWQRPPFDFRLSKSEDISKEELIKVAESVRL